MQLESESNRSVNRIDTMAGRNARSNAPAKSIFRNTDEKSGGVIIKRIIEDATTEG